MLAGKSPFRKPPGGGYVDLYTSDSAGWTSLQFRVSRVFSGSEEYETAKRNELAIHLHLDEIPYQEHLLEGRWRGLRLHPGTISSTPAGQIRRMRYGIGRSKNVHTMMHMYIPQKTIASVAAELPASSVQQRHIAGLSTFENPKLHDYALAVLSASRSEAPDFYAETTALWLSANLLLGLHKTDQWRETLALDKVRDTSLVRVMEYIDVHLGECLSLNVLAREAGLSVFSFAAAFQKALGTSPHRHVQHLRLKAGASLLSDTKKPVAEIALLCGFATPSHFGVAFRKRFLQSPSEYRYTCLRNKLGLIPTRGPT